MIKRKTGDYWVKTLGLEPHPEGGWFKETYRAEDTISQLGLPDRFNGERSASTAIYFLLQSGEVSHFHRIKSDEMWHFYAGIPLTVHIIDPMGVLFHLKLGNNPDEGEVLQGLVKAGCWFGASLDENEGYALVGCTVAPGFDFSDFEMAKREDLLELYPEYQDTINKLT